MIKFNGFSSLGIVVDMFLLVFFENIERKVFNEFKLYF